MSVQPKVPENICEESKNYVRSVIEALGDTITSMDVFAIERVGYAHNTWITAEKTLMADGYTQKSERGITASHPCVKIALDAKIQIDKFENTYGLNPKSRKEISKPKEKKGKLSPIDEFIQSNREVR